MGRIALGVDPKAKPTRVYALVNALPRLDRVLSIGRRRRDVRAHGRAARQAVLLAGGRARRRSEQAAQAAAARRGRRRERRGAARSAAPADAADAAARAGVVLRRRPRLLLRDLRRSGPARHDLVGEHEPRVEPGRRQDVLVRVPNMNGVHVDFHVVWARSEGLDAHPRRQRRRRVRVVGRRQDVAALLEPADHAVLSRGRRQRAAVLQRVRRRAGQRIDVRPVALDQRASASARATGVTRAAATASSIAHRSGRSEHRLRVVAGRRDRAARSCATGAEQAASVRRSRRVRRARRRRRRGGAAAARAAAAGGGRGGGRSHELGRAVHHQPASRRRGSTGAATTSIARDDRGDHWTTISPDLTRNLDPRVIPIMGKVWDPDDDRRLQQRDDDAQHIVAIDESPLMEGLIYVGTDDGNLQVTEDGGKTWRKTTQFAELPGRHVRHARLRVAASTRTSCSSTLNNWQRGDFKPYLVRSDDRGKTFKSITGDLPMGQDVWSIVQDCVNRNLLFAGTEFGLFFTRGRRHALDAAQGRLPVGAGARAEVPEARERSRARRRSAAASTSSTTTARSAR